MSPMCCWFCRHNTRVTESCRLPQTFQRKVSEVRQEVARSDSPQEILRATHEAVKRKLELEWRLQGVGDAKTWGICQGKLCTPSGGDSRSHVGYKWHSYRGGATQDWHHMLSTADMELEELTSALMSLSFSDLIYALIPPFWNSGIVTPILCRCLLEIYDTLFNVIGAHS